MLAVRVLKADDSSAGDSSQANQDYEAAVRFWRGMGSPPDDQIDLLAYKGDPPEVRLKVSLALKAFCKSQTTAAALASTASGVDELQTATA